MPPKDLISKYTITLEIRVSTQEFWRYTNIWPIVKIQERNRQDRDDQDTLFFPADTFATPHPPEKCVYIYFVSDMPTLWVNGGVRKLLCNRLNSRKNNSNDATL